jgi:hypothetical protein
MRSKASYPRCDALVLLCRYGFGGEPLWPSARRAPAPPCARCGAPRRFEAQLLATLIHFFSEGPAAAQPGLLADALADWDWTTVMLHSCSRVRARVLAVRRPQPGECSAAD